jgi:hypothetical protein
MHSVRWLLALTDGGYREVDGQTLPARCLHPGDLPQVGDFVNFGKWKYRVAHRHWSWDPTPDGLLTELKIVLEVLGEVQEGGL